MIIILTSVFSVALPNTSMAVDDWDTMKQKADAFIEKGKQEGDSLVTDDKLKDLAFPIMRTLLAIASIVLVIVMLVMGMKYMMGSPDQKAKLKQQLIGLVVAIIVIYGAYGIWSMVYNFMIDVAS